MHCCWFGRMAVILSGCCIPRKAHNPIGSILGKFAALSSHRGRQCGVLFKRMLFNGDFRFASRPRADADPYYGHTRLRNSDLGSAAISAIESLWASVSAVRLSEFFSE